MRTRGKFASSRGNVMEFFGARNDLKCYLPLTEHLTDVSGGGKHGTGVSTLYAPTGTGIGHSNSQASTRYVKIGALGISAPANPYTIMVRSTQRTATDCCPILNGNDLPVHTGYYDVILYISSAGVVYNYINKSQVWACYTTTRSVVRVGREHIFCISYDGSGSSNGMSTIIDGSKELNTIAANSIGTAPTAWDDWNIGAARVKTTNYDLTQCGESTTRDVAVFNTKLTDSEIIEYQRWILDLPSKKFFAMDSLNMAYYQALLRRHAA